MMNSVRYWQTGIPKLDQLVFDGRGFRAGRGYIISGPSQSGKTILAMCFVKNMIAQGGAFTYITIGRPAKNLVELFQEFNVDINSYLEAMDLVILDWATVRSGGNTERAKRYLRQSLSEKAVANIRFGVDPCNKREFLYRITTVHEEKASYHGKPGLAVVDSISDHVVLVSRKGLPGSIVSDIYFSARQKFSLEEPGTAFHLFAPLEERVSLEYARLLEDLHLNEDGTINLTIESEGAGKISTRNMWVRSLYGSKVLIKRLNFNITAEDPFIIIGSDLGEETMPSGLYADVTILTVLPEEYQAICCKVNNLQSAPQLGDHANLYAWKIGTVSSGASTYSMAVGMMGRAGTIESALATTDALKRWNSRYIFFVGVAGGLAGVSKGDVVIADIIHGYEYGKIEKKFIPRSNWTYRTDIGLLNGAVAHSASNWNRLVQAKPPIECTVKATQGEIASGDKVVDDPSSQFFAGVLKMWPKIKAVEMEGAGAGNSIEHAQSLGKTVSFMMIRGISDLPRLSQEVGEEDKARGTQERDVWKNYAADTAAAFTISFISSGLPLPPRD